MLKSTQDAVIDLRLTVPFGCSANTIQCYLDVNIFMPRSDRCEMADAGIQQSILNPCGVRFSNNETGLVKSIRLQAIIAPRIAPQRRLIKADLVTQRSYNAHPIFEGYHIKSVEVSFCSYQHVTQFIFLGCLIKHIKKTRINILKELLLL